MSNLLSQAAASGRDHDLHRSDFQNVLKSESLIRTVFVDVTGHIQLETCRLEEYWDDVMVADVGLCQRLDILRLARSRYITSNYARDRAVQYCHTYFSLLCDMLDKANDLDGLLKALIGLEVFGISWFGQSDPLAAGAITVRHPVYMLAKLREPNAYDDAKFLPVVSPITVNSSADKLFYHYRKIKLQDKPSTSLLIYPASELSCRQESFACIEAISSALSFKPDPRSKQRAKLITDWAISPFCANQKHQRTLSQEINFLDIGGGTGALLSEICKRLVQDQRQILTGRKFAWSIVDVSLQDVTRRTRSQDFRSHMAYIDYQPADYADWIHTQDARKQCTYDIALICRLLNNMSRVVIEPSNDPSVIKELASVRKRPAPEVFLPADCLDSSLADCISLVASNAYQRWYYISASLIKRLFSWFILCQ
ncbi:hypothetical protein JD969_08485 [Planctomycetota bacterium]|nr:hypothetical protein JD969_08485 [Planctomycetota bacterium]